MKRFAVVSASLLVVSSAFAGGTGCGAFCPDPIPELDGSMALLALGLTAALVAIVRERLRRR